ncbi:tetratricopeptide repeat protein [Paenibacillus sp. N1-5-1-14]|uniref:J domain-containing protein n=1 Tax=Paenibacillus radicibacter TaxID=2972488 RepID=UPI002158E976|nr:J domain-containing protein [Paenibacillus radicibacter]MCR8645331.1 tetratricopeptide repeat protein [Paenibacillus radicibacter]
MWQVLGIKPTDDLSVIKRAYAKMLKVHHPEDDSEGYQRLREAYDAAIEWVKSDRSVQETEEEEDDSSWEEDEDNGYVPHQLNGLNEEQRVISLQADRNAAAKIHAFMKKLSSLYDDFYARMDVQCWSELLEDDALWNMEIKEELNEQVRWFFDHHRDVPNFVWELLEESQLITEDMDEEYEDLYIFLRHQQAVPELSYAFMHLAPDIDHEAFWLNRKFAYFLFVKGDMEQAGRYIEEAYNLFPNDPELLRLRGRYWIEQRNWEEALATYEHLSTLYPDDLETYYICANIWFDMGSFEQAQSACKFLLEQEPTNKDFLILLGKCELRLGRAEQAREIWNQLSPDQLDIGTVAYLAEAQSICIRQVERGASSGRKQRLAELYREAGKPSLKYQLQAMKYGLYTLRPIRLLIVIILLGLFTSGVGGAYYKLIQERMETTTEVTSIEQLGQLNNVKIHLMLDNASNTTIVVVKHKDGTKTYTTQAEAKIMGYDKRKISYMSIGFLNDVPLAVITNNDEKIDYASGDHVEVTGRMMSAVPEELLHIKSSVLVQPKSLEVDQDLLKKPYIDTTSVIPDKEMPVKIVIASIMFWLLLLLEVYLMYRFYRIFKSFRY